MLLARNVPIFFTIQVKAMLVRSLLAPRIVFIKRLQSSNTTLFLNINSLLHLLSTPFHTQSAIKWSNKSVENRVRFMDFRQIKLKFNNRNEFEAN